MTKMTKKIRTLLALGVVTVATASTMVPVNALSKDTLNNTTTKGAVYVCINGVKYKLPLNSGCPNQPSTPDMTPEVKPDIPVEKPDTTPEVKPDVPVEKPEDTGSFSAFQKEVVDLVNIERSKRGLSTLKLDSALSNVATTKSQDMINKNYFDHNSPTYGSPFDMMKQFGINYKSAGENIAMGQKTPKEVVNAWMNSQGHRENILNSNFTNIGVGIAKDSSGSIYWTQMFIGK